ncbi:MAG: hypothetical protein KGJ32_03015 [Xanthomonadaceae bacterium]|nr:hypothetical protein [Xanthomonadaceae bacterium]
MTRPSLHRIADALATAFLYCAACALAVPLLALDGVQRVRRWLGVKP